MRGWGVEAVGVSGGGEEKAVGVRRWGMGGGCGCEGMGDGRRLWV